MAENLSIRKVLISRTDSIGDVILTLPMAGLLKKHMPDAEVFFLGRNYTLPILAQCTHLSGSISMDNPTWKQQLRARQFDAIIHVFPRKSIAQEALSAGIPMRIGVSRRWYHLYACNKLLHFSRKHSDLHEARLNLKLLSPLIGEHEVPLSSISDYYGLIAPQKLPFDIEKKLDSQRKKIILHPLSQGSAREWGTHNFKVLAKALLEKGYQVIITGTANEQVRYSAALQIEHSHFIDLGGKLSLEELMALISKCDALVAASTGPLHLAAAFGIKAIGLYSPLRPIHPGRWAPLGRDVSVITHNVAAEIGKKAKTDNSMALISPERVLSLLNF
jgi:ADP-heptose:LPS heptosyltransferase